jgi:hypothetical protein
MSFNFSSLHLGMLIPTDKQLTVHGRNHQRTTVEFKLQHKGFQHPEIGILEIDVTQ